MDDCLAVVIESFLEPIHLQSANFTTPWVCIRVEFLQIIELQIFRQDIIELSLIKTILVHFEANVLGEGRDIEQVKLLRQSASEVVLANSHVALHDDHLAVGIHPGLRAIKDLVEGVERLALVVPWFSIGIFGPMRGNKSGYRNPVLNIHSGTFAALFKEQGATSLRG